MPKLIILEGPDCCGKTTLARDLVTKLRAAYLHNTYIEKFSKTVWDYRFNRPYEMLDTPAQYDSSVYCPYVFLYHEELLRQAFLNLELNRHVVMDRCWLSELVYTTCLRKVSDELLLPWINKLTNQLTTRIIDGEHIDYSFVFCLSEKGREIHEAQRDEAHPYTSEQWDDLYKSYQSLALAMSPRNRCFTYDLDDSDNAYDLVKQLI